MPPTRKKRSLAGLIKGFFTGGIVSSLLLTSVAFSDSHKIENAILGPMYGFYNKINATIENGFITSLYGNSGDRLIDVNISQSRYLDTTYFDGYDKDGITDFIVYDSTTNLQIMRGIQRDFVLDIINRYTFERDLISSKGVYQGKKVDLEMNKNYVKGTYLGFKIHWEIIRNSKGEIVKIKEKNLLNQVFGNTDFEIQRRNDYIRAVGVFAGEDLDLKFKLDSLVSEEAQILAVLYG